MESQFKNNSSSLSLLDGNLDTEDISFPTSETREFKFKIAQSVSPKDQTTLSTPPLANRDYFARARRATSAMMMSTYLDRPAASAKGRECASSWTCAQTRRVRSKETFQIARARSVDVDAYAHASARNDRKRRVEWLYSAIRARLAHAPTGEADTGALELK